MLFSLKRIFHNIRRNLGVYLVFILEFAFGITIFIGTLNVSFAIYDDLNDAKKEMASEKINLVYNSNGMNWQDESWEDKAAFTYKQYLDAKEKYGNNLNFLYMNSIRQTQYLNYKNIPCKSEEVGYFYLWNTFINDEAFEEMFGTHMEPGKIYAGEEAYKRLEKYKYYSTQQDYAFGGPEHPKLITIENGEYCLSGKNIYKLEKIPLCEETLIPHSIDAPAPELDPGTLISECVFIPIEEYTIYVDLVNSSGTYKASYEQFDLRGHLSVKYKNSDVKGNIIPDLLEFMAENCEYKFEFRVDNTYMHIMNKFRMIQVSLIEQMVISVSVLLIVFFGTTGHFIIYFYRRKQQMAVSIAYGSTKKRLILEVMTEILLITGIGAVCGIMLMHKLMPYATETYTNAEFRMESVIIAILIAVVTSVLSTLLSFTGIKEISPANILKDL